MGTVFSVLIFISFVISLLKYLPGFLERFRLKKAATAEWIEASPEQIVSEDSSLQDDQVVVAVITAALTAYKASQTPSGDGYFVRSIKRI
jgi:glutaconyl-CoA/methylmalonyl-CoA decarboxylase subunit delta